MPYKPCGLFIVFAALCLMPIGCTNNVSGVETTNGVTVVATSGSIEGTAPPFANIYLFDTSYIPYINSGTGIATAADANGLFRILAAPGAYNVLALNPYYDEAGVISPAVINGESDNSSQTKRMQRVGSLRGSVLNGSVEGGSTLVYLSGAGYYCVVNGSGTFSFNMVAPGPYRLCAALLHENGSATIEPKRDVPVIIEPGKELFVGEIDF